MAWDPGQYLRFERERTQPSRDLAARIEVAEPRAVLDLGCGPGNSTAVLADRFGAERVTGADVSPEMLERAAFPSDPTTGELILEFPRLFWLATKGE